MIDHMLENERTWESVERLVMEARVEFESPTNYGVDKGERRRKRKKKEK